MIDYLIELDKKVPLKELVAKGIMDWTLVRDRDIYMQYDSLIKTGHRIMDAYKLIADEWKLSTRVIIRSVNLMKYGSKSNTH